MGAVYAEGGGAGVTRGAINGLSSAVETVISITQDSLCVAESVCLVARHPGARLAADSLSACVPLPLF
jgi:hypothetical protein